MQVDEKSPVFDCGDIAIQGAPVVGNNDEAALSLELNRDAFIAKVTMPCPSGHRFHRYRLARLLEQSHEGTVAVQGVHIVQHKEFVLVLVQQLVELKRREVTVNVLTGATSCRLDNGGFGNSGLANKNDVVLRLRQSASQVSSSPRWLVG
ncbi:MAG: hypothetical protein KF857_08515 [Fimbriimonadaceae bacterium]|nr:hypothetical protein [Fimbriimonadaceae bacterium]